ncbi:hypothetical protein PENTCL1PPCAC_13342 [Pristionchus entomophagus]|uniref:N-acetyltransferase domain-containing protein n=1 Tax=Pristionchus entomophagus TaxID=358040 RepID=A0AAV5T6H9_9BILA|nr:hypothetical protein PENTCL1PPCAC_13342 [Pristionchus entomophagus]
MHTVSFLSPMRLNQFTLLIGDRIVLVPYEKKHVPKYHEWMMDPQLREATASEPLSLEEEFEMQKTWRNDEDKLTFIVLDRKKWEESGKNEIISMVGDVNLFIVEGEAECEIMIAEKEERTKGRGTEAMMMMIGYALEEWDDDLEFIAKIGYDNDQSIRLFVHKFGFVEEGRSEVFREISFRLPRDNNHRFRYFYRSKVTKEEIEEREEEEDH